MKKSIFTIMAIFAFAILPIAAIAQNIQQPYIDMQARVEREVSPNELYVTIIIKESDYKGKKSLEQMQNKMLSVLTNNKIDIAESLSLNYMGSNVSYKVFSKRIVPRTEATYTLKLHDATVMQKIIYELETNEITNISLTSTKYTNEDALKTELGVEALKKAQEQARAYAGAIGQEIGKALSISSWSSQNSQQPRMYKSNVMMSANADAVAVESAPEISIGKLTYTVTVDVKFELK